MTSASPQTQRGTNPYLDVFLEASGGRYHEIWSDYWPADVDMKLMQGRHDWTHHYAWAVPHEGALRLLVDHSPLVEIGAGGGYWTMLLRDRGADVIAYDAQPGANHWAKHLWTHIERGDASRARLHPERTLFLCWPPYQRRMAHHALRAYLEVGGRRVVYVGEHEGGCCADDRFFELLERELTQVSEISIPQFPGMRDYLTAWER